MKSLNRNERRKIEIAEDKAIRKNHLVALSFVEELKAAVQWYIDSSDAKNRDLLFLAERRNQSENSVSF